MPDPRDSTLVAAFLLILATLASELTKPLAKFVKLQCANLAARLREYNHRLKKRIEKSRGE